MPNDTRVPVLSLPRNAETLDPRARIIAENNARIRFWAGISEDEEDEATDNGAARCAAAARED
jgi:hypothetical protein